MSEARIQYPREDSPIWEEMFYAVVDEAARHRGGMHWEPLEYLAGAEYPGPMASVREGATFKSLAYVGHRLGMNADERQRWYKIASRLPLSQAHVGIIIARLNERDTMLEELDALLTADAGLV